MITVRFKDTFRDRLPEWVSSACLLLWGLLILNLSTETWSTEYVSILGTLAAQKTWGMAAVALGVLRLVALGINGAWRPTAHIRALGAIGGIVVWSGIIISYLTLSWDPPTLATKGAMLVFDMYALWFAAGDAKVADVIARERAESLLNNE